MRPNAAKQRLLAGEPAIGIFVAANSPLVAEAVGKTGLSWVCVDLQHGEANLGTLSPLLTAISATPAMPYARVPYNDFKEIGRALDLGAYGIIVPLVNTAAEAMEAAKAAKYPPYGDRSYGPIRGALYSGGDYFGGADRETSLFVMIETREGVENAEAILAVEGVDGCYIGPSDLSIAYGVSPNVGTAEHLDPVVEEGIERVLAAARATGKIVGMHLFSATAANRRLAQGIRMIGLGSELRFATRGITDALAEIGRK
ncbi:MAG: aldolase/citrate lyase family protein [Chloroflexota bacterium]|nr:aldolase/citrate lyase family protein [Chloroflexota bacterium]